MLRNRVNLPEDGKPRSGNFYIPRLGQLNAAQHLPVLMSRFVAQYRASFDDEIHIPKRLKLSEFGDLADHLHILALASSPQSRPAPTRRALSLKPVVERGQSWTPMRGQN